jgi:ketosteroid isomerase-like protein
MRLSVKRQLFSFTMEKDKLNEAIALNWFKAFNEHHLEDLLSLYADDAEHFSPKLKVRRPQTQGLVRGKNALRTWWQDSFDRLPSLKYTVKTLTANEDRVFMEYLRQVDSEPDMMVAEVLEIQDGKIVFSRVYHA